MNDLTRYHVIFHGRVQGVGFRAYVIRCAQSCGITGWVQNLCGGDVAAQFQGAREKIDLALAQICSPPSYSRIEIERIETQRIEVVKNETGFGVRW